MAAVLLPRQFPLLAAMMGTLRSGNAYLLLSTELPVKRVLSIYQKSGAGVLITDEETAGQMGREAEDIRFLIMDRLTGNGMGKAPARVNRRILPMWYIPQEAPESQREWKSRREAF